MIVMLRNLQSYCIALITFVVIDLVWTNIAAHELYHRALSSLLADQVQLAPALLLYLVYIAGLVYFVIAPALHKESKKDNLQPALARAALLGLVAYASYDLTNLATLKNWPLTITLVDIAWGIVLTTATTAVTLIAMQSKWLKKT